MLSVSYVNLDSEQMHMRRIERKSSISTRKLPWIEIVDYCFVWNNYFLMKQNLVWLLKGLDRKNSRIMILFIYCLPIWYGCKVFYDRESLSA